MSKKARNKGIFCLEGLWGLDKISCTSSVRPILELLSHNPQVQIPSIHKDFATKDEFMFYIILWSKKYQKDHPILYISSHGTEQGVCVSDGKEITLNVIAEQLEGKCKKCIIHFGCCHSLATHGNKLNTFLDQTGALAISGYENSVPWIKSAAFEIMLFASMQENEFTRRGINAIKNKCYDKVSKSLCKELTFKFKFKHKPVYM